MTTKYNRFGKNPAAIGLELDDVIGLTPTWVIFAGAMNGSPVFALEFLPEVLAKEPDVNRLVREPRSDRAASTTGIDNLGERELADRMTREFYTYDDLVYRKWGSNLEGLSADFPSAQFAGRLGDRGTIFVVLEGDINALTGLAAAPLAATELSSLAFEISDALEPRHGQGLLHLDMSSDWLGAKFKDLSPLGPSGADLRKVAHAGDEQQLLARKNTTPPELLDISQKAQIGPWTDIYQASAVLFHLATGEPRPSWAMSSKEARDLLDAQPQLEGHDALKASIAAGLEPVIARRPALVATWLEGLERADQTPAAAQTIPLLTTPAAVPKQAAPAEVPDESPPPQPPEEVSQRLYRAPRRSGAERLQGSLLGGLAAGLVAGTWPLWLSAAEPLTILADSPLASTIWLAQAVMIGLTHGAAMPAFLKAFRPTLPIVSYLAFLWKFDFDMGYLGGVGLFGLGLAGLAAFVLPAVLQLTAFRQRWSKGSAAAAAALALALNFTGMIYGSGAQASDADAGAATEAASEAAMAATPSPTPSPTEEAAASEAASATDWNGLVGLWTLSGESCEQAWSFGPANTIARPDGTIWSLEPVAEADATGGLTMRLKSSSKNGETGPVNEVTYKFMQVGDSLTMSDNDNSNAPKLQFEACK